jgi:hypothetical protein
MLTLGWSDGTTLIPVNFSLLSSQQEKTCLRPVREDKTAAVAVERRILARTKAPEVVLSLIRLAKQTGLQAGHVLCDSWFSFPALIRSLKAEGYHTVAMVKKTKKVYYSYEGKRVSVMDIYKMNRKRRGRSRYLLSVTGALSPTEDGHPAIPVRLVYVRNRNKRNEYLVLLSTDMELTEEEIIQLYGKRWSIECFFKVCKSYLRLIKGYRGLDYDAITAHVAIVFAQYVMLSEYQRLDTDHRSLGDLFFDAMDELGDLRYEEALALILCALFNTATEVLCLSDEDSAKLFDAFLSTIPTPLTKRLGIAA